MQEIAATVSDQPAAAHQYRYIATHAWWLGTFGTHQYLAEHHTRQWVPVREDLEWQLEREPTGAVTWLNGSGRQALDEGFDLRATAPSGRFRARHGAFTDAEGELGDFGGCPALPRQGGVGRGSWQTPTSSFLQRLPRDPQRLRQRICEENPGRWFTPFAAAVTALRTGVVPADLRRALYRALLELPGVRVAERVSDLDGRQCRALVHDVGSTRTELMVDPANGHFAGERDTIRSDSRCGLRAGTVISTTAVRTAVVDGLGARP